MRGKSGIIFLVFFLSLYSCTAQQPGSDFYEGLKKKRENRQAEAAARFSKALNSRNTFAASAAAAELMNLRHGGTVIPAAAMAKIRRNASGSWAQAFEAVKDIPADREKALVLFFSGGRDRFRDDAALYTLEEWRRAADNDAADSPFSEAENAAIDGRRAAALSRYGEALIFFRIALRDSPELFLQYPDLLADLGRTFQYATGGSEGADLFLEWEKTLPPDENHIRFLLFFYAGRITHYRGGKSAELFARALPLAPENENEQADACIWYILDSALAAGPAAAISQLEAYASRWHNDSYFADIMDKLARELVLRRQWGDLLRVFSLIRDWPGTAAHYAWIIGRAIEAELFSPAEIRRAEEIIPVAAVIDETLSQAYIRTAYNAGMLSLYYRATSAAALGEPLFSFPTTRPPAGGRESEAMQFLLGFFRHNAAEFAARYVREAESSLSPDELRRLAEAYGAAGQYQQSMRLVSLYTKQEGYRLVRKDLELSHPRPYRDMVERYAAETGLEPALLFGLIRTESAFDQNAVSRAGAAGLTQLMPATAEEAAARLRRQGGPDYTGSSSINLRDPAANIHIGASYLAFLNERMGDPLLALLAYNGGMNRVRRWLAASAGTLPPDLFLETVDYAETRDYGRRVIAAAAVYRELYYK